LKFFFDWLIVSTITGSILVLLITIIKFIFKNKLGSMWHYYIWIILLIRLLVPYIYLPESPISIMNLNVFSNGKQIISSNDIPNINTTSTLSSNSNNNSNNSTKTNYKKSSKVIDLTTKEIIFYIWLIGAILVFAYIILQNFILNNKLNRYNLCSSENIIIILNECCEIIGTRRNIPILVTSKNTPPFICGLLSPKIVISIDTINDLNSNEIKFVLMHELTHIKRKDLVINWIVIVLQSIHWFNPFIWYAFIRMKYDCEVSCDGNVLKKLNYEDHSKYGQTIINLIKSLSKPFYTLTPTTGVIQNKESLKKRLLMITNFNKIGWKRKFATLIFIIVISIPSLTVTKTNVHSLTTSDKSFVNVALNKNITASSIESSTTSRGSVVASNANDNNLSTRWSSNFNDSEWVQIDLGSLHKIYSIYLTWEVSSAKDYTIQTSDDGKKWYNAVNKKNMQTGSRVDLLEIKKVCRYVKLLCKSRTTKYGYSLYEFAVYGEPTVTTKVTGIKITPTSIDVNETFKLSAEVLPEEATNKNIIWASDDPTIATVDNNGLVKGIKKGKTKITVKTKDGSLTDKCDVNVTKISTFEKIEAESFTIKSNSPSIEECSEGGKSIGYIQNTDYLIYNVNIPSSGTYIISFRVASENSTGQVILGKDGKDLSNNLDIPDTGGWTKWETISTKANLESGIQDLTIYAKNGGWNLNWWSIKKVVN